MIIFDKTSYKYTKIMIKQYIYIAIAVFLLAIFSTIGILIHQNTKLKAENKIKTKNIEVLNDSIKYFNTTDSLQAAKIGELNYTVDEFKKFRAADEQTINSLNLKLKNVKSITNIQTITETKFETKLVYRDSLKCFDWKDEFTSINGCVKDSTISVNYSNVERLSAVINTRYKHNFLFFHWGLKINDLYVKSMNKNTKISKIDYITVNNK